MSTITDTIITEGKYWITKLIGCVPVMDTFILVKDGLVIQILITITALDTDSNFFQLCLFFVFKNNKIKMVHDAYGT